MVDYKNLQPLKYVIQTILPQVYTDALSNLELQNKIVSQLNILVENNNLLPSYIQEMIENYISSGAIGEVVNQILVNFMLNVKNPPLGITPAKGDGTADDTKAIQGCIDYANANGGKCVYFPSGKYLTSALTLKDNVSLSGFDCKSTVLVLKGGGTKALINGTVNNNVIANLGFDGNSATQVNNVNCMDLITNSFTLTNCSVTDGWTLLNLQCGGNTFINNNLFESAVEYGIVSSGIGLLKFTGNVFNTLSELKGKNIIKNSINNAIFNDLYSTCECAVAINNTGTNCAFTGLILNADKKLNDSTNTAYFNFYNDSTEIEQIKTEIQNRINADNALQNSIDSEKLARENADNDLQQNIDTEKQARENADTVLQQNITNEITNRENADSELLNKIKIILNVKYYGCKCDGVTDDFIALNNLISANETNECEFIFPSGVCLIAQNLIVPPNITLNFENGGKISVNQNKTITINGGIKAGIQEIFIGSGSFVGDVNVDYIYPQWFGAKGDNINDDSVAINKAIKLSETQTQFNNKIVKLIPAHYLIKNSLVITHGTETRRTIIEGYGATIRAGLTDMDMIQIVASGSPETYGNLGQTKLKGFRMECAGIAKRGIMIGRISPSYPYGVDGTFKSLISEIDIRDYKTAGIEISDSRLFEVVNCTIFSSIAGSNCVFLNCVNGTTLTDHWFTNCQFAVNGGNTANVCVRMLATATTTPSGIGGIHFTDCVMYGQAIKADGTNDDGTISDIFICNCATDGANTSAVPGYYGFYFKTVDNKKSSNILIDNSWVNACGVGIYLYGLSSCSIANSKISSTFYQGVMIDTCHECSLVNCKLYDVNTSNNGGGCVSLGGVGNMNKIIGNNIFNTTGHDATIILITATQVKPFACFNSTQSGTCVTNNVAGSDGVDYVVMGNL